MELLKNLGKKIMIIVAICAAIIVVGLAGQLDHDEYIEVNQTPQTGIRYWRGN